MRRSYKKGLRELEGWTYYQITSLSPLQARILDLLGLPESIFAPPLLPDDFW